MTGAEQFARPPERQIDVGELWSIMDGFKRFQAFDGQFVFCVREEKTVRAYVPTPYPPPELMELRKPKAIGMLDYH